MNKGGSTRDNQKKWGGDFSQRTGLGVGGEMGGGSKKRGAGAKHALGEGERAKG